MKRHVTLALAVVLAIGDCSRFLEEEIRAGFTVASDRNHKHKREYRLASQAFRLLVVFHNAPVSAYQLREG